MIKQLSSLFQKAYTSLLSEKTKHIFEKIRLSFAATGLLNTALIISAVVFGLVILIIHNQFEKKLSLQENLNNHEYDA